MYEKIARLLWNLVFGQNFPWFSLTSRWKLCLFWKKTKNDFRFLSVYDFSIVWQEFLGRSSINIYNFFSIWKSTSGYRALQYSFFLLSFAFYLYTNIQYHVWSLCRWPIFSSNQISRWVFSLLHPSTLIILR